VLSSEDSEENGRSEDESVGHERALSLSHALHQGHDGQNATLNRLESRYWFHPGGALPLPPRAVARWGQAVASLLEPSRVLLSGGLPSAVEAAGR
jgi:hypothetical protein